MQKLEEREEQLNRREGLVHQREQLVHQGEEGVRLREQEVRLCEGKSILQTPMRGVKVGPLDTLLASSSHLVSLASISASPLPPGDACPSINAHCSQFCDWHRPPLGRPEQCPLLG